MKHLISRRIGNRYSWFSETHDTWVENHFEASRYDEKDATAMAASLKAVLHTSFIQTVPLPAAKYVSGLNKDSYE